MLKVDLLPIIGTAEDIAAIAQLWNASAPADLQINEEFIRYNLAPNPIFQSRGTFAVMDGKKIGLAILSFRVVAGETESSWLDMMCVLPEYQRQDVGDTLYRWVENTARENGALQLRIGGGYRTFLAGIPDELPVSDFFTQYGYNTANPRLEWDVVRDLTTYEQQFPMPIGIASAYQLAPKDEPLLREFINRTFPGRWTYEIEDFLRIGGRISDFVGLKVGERIEGFTWMTFADSARPLNRYFMSKLPEPWGQIGPLGISPSVRGLGYSLPMIECAVLVQKSMGIRSSLIDWTDLLDYYAKLGYQPSRRYQVIMKVL